ncbi:MAG: hypothetical protein LUC44_07600 [Prevotellaceae bacterium]|nr:hypothetical protein [Prevotellaceae bacterium]
MDEKKVNCRLNLLAWCLVGVAAVLLLLGETEVLPLGLLPTSYALQICECLVMLVCVPLALKLMAFRSVRGRLAAQPRLYPSLAAVRIILLALPMIAGVALYFLMLDTSMLYCALISTLAFIYIWPSEDRQRAELEAHNKEELRP